MSIMYIARERERERENSIMKHNILCNINTRTACEEETAQDFLGGLDQGLEPGISHAISEPSRCEYIITLFVGNNSTGISVVVPLMMSW